MACGTPVIASNTTSLPEVIGDAGLLFNPHDVDDISHSIERIIQDSELRDDLIQRGLQRVKDYSWDFTADKIWQVLIQARDEILHQ